MNKLVLESKAIIDAKWSKSLDKLTTVRDATWPDVDIDIIIWEVIVDIKAIPSADSD